MSTITVRVDYDDDNVDNLNALHDSLVMVVQGVLDWVPRRAVVTTIVEK